MNYGCKIGLQNANIIVYADDIVLLSPSISGLQILLNEAVHVTSQIGLKFNPQKCKHLLFRATGKCILAEPVLSILGEKLERVQSFKYLGFILTYNLCNSEDINRARSTFYSNFNNLLRKFYFADVNVKTFLFSSFCLHFYGNDTWFCNRGAVTSLKHFAIGYHRAIKKLLGLSSRESNHYACQEARLLTFEHLLNKNKILVAFRFYNSKCPFIQKSLYYFRDFSCFLCEVRDLFLNKYDIANVFDQDIDAILSRIIFVQNHEPQMREGWE